MTVLLQVLTLFLLMLCGFTAVRSGKLDDRGLSGLHMLVLTFAQPALILHKLQTPASPELIGEVAWVFFLACATIALAGVISFRVFKGQTASRRSVLTTLSMVSNCGFMGFPIISATLGDEALIHGVVFLAAFNLMSWTMCAFYFGGKEAMQPQRLLKNPTIWSIAGGLFLFLTGWSLPSFINDALGMLGATTTPLAMFVIGARLVGLRREHLTDAPMLLSCALRLLVFPLCILLLRLTPLPEMVINTVFLCTAMPGAALTAMQAEMYGCEKELASRAVAVSTALSIATIPLLLMLI